MELMTASGTEALSSSGLEVDDSGGGRGLGLVATDVNIANVPGVRDTGLEGLEVQGPSTPIATPGPTPTALGTS